jgi:hypothetical protein
VFLHSTFLVACCAGICRVYITHCASGSSGLRIRRSSWITIGKTFLHVQNSGKYI